MKTGKSLPELALELERQRTAKRDFIADTRHLNFTDDGTLGITNGHYETFPVTDITHRQISEWAGIPAKYYDRMRTENPSLLAVNVNNWFHQQPAQRMIRTLDDSARAFLSDRYRRLENTDLAEAILPTLMDLKLEIMSCEITDRKLYIKAVSADINRDIPHGNRLGDGSHVWIDTVSPAIVISNSEIGMGSLSLETAIYTRVCTNLAVVGERSLKKYHIGATQGGDEFSKLLTDETKAVTDKAIWLQVRDVARAAFEEAKFDSMVDDLRATTAHRISGDPVKAIELAAAKFLMTEDERGSVLNHLISGGDLSQWGVASAITRTAQDLASYDRATDFEKIGGKVLEFKEAEWREIAEMK